MLQRKTVSKHIWVNCRPFLLTAWTVNMCCVFLHGVKLLVNICHFPTSGRKQPFSTVSSSWLWLMALLTQTSSFIICLNLHGNPKSEPFTQFLKGKVIYSFEANVQICWMHCQVRTTCSPGLITDADGPSLVNKSNYQNQPTQLSPAKDGPMCQTPFTKWMRIIDRWSDDKVYSWSIELDCWDRSCDPNSEVTWLFSWTHSWILGRPGHKQALTR